MDREEILYASFAEHFAELRTLMMRMAACILAGMALCLLFYQPLISLLTYPVKSSAFFDQENFQEDLYQQIRVSNRGPETKTFTLPTDALPPSHLSNNAMQIGPDHYALPPHEFLIYSKKAPRSLMILGPLEGMFALLKITAWGGTVLTSPFWLFLLLRFISPGLKKNEKQLISPFILLSCLFILLGFATALYITIPLANHYLYQLNQQIGQDAWSLNQYLDYTLFFLFGHGFAFELGVVGIFGVRCGLFTTQALVKQRKFAILFAFILGALLTPPDVFSQLLLASLLIAFYELLIVYARFSCKIS